MFKSLKTITLTISCALGFLFTHNLHASEQEVNYTEQVLTLSTTVGSPDAPYRVTEFFSYTCRHCHELADNTKFNNFKNKLINDVQVSFRYAHLPLNRTDHKLGIAHRCFVHSYNDRDKKNKKSTANIYHDTRTMFFRSPQEKKNDHSPTDVHPAQDQNVYSSCKDSVKPESYWSQQRSKATEHQIKGTPSFIIEKKCDNGYCRVNESPINKDNIINTLSAIIHAESSLNIETDEPAQKASVVQRLQNWFQH